MPAWSHDAAVGLTCEWKPSVAASRSPACGPAWGEARLTLAGRDGVAPLLGGGAGATLLLLWTKVVIDSEGCSCGDK